MAVVAVVQALVRPKANSHHNRTNKRYTGMVQLTLMRSGRYLIFTAGLCDLPLMIVI